MSSGRWIRESVHKILLQHELSCIWSQMEAATNSGMFWIANGFQITKKRLNISTFHARLKWNDVKKDMISTTIPSKQDSIKYMNWKELLYKGTITNTDRTWLSENGSAVR